MEGFLEKMYKLQAQLPCVTEGLRSTKNINREDVKSCDETAETLLRGCADLEEILQKYSPIQIKQEVEPPEEIYVAGEFHNVENESDAAEDPWDDDPEPADQHDVKSELSSATEEPEAKMAARVEFDECKLVLKADICSLCGVKFNKEVHNCKCDGGNTAAGNLQANGMGRKKRKRQGSGKKGRPKGTGEKRPKTEKPDSYSCELCGCVLKTRRGLKYHQSKHTGVYNFRCPLCNKGYNRRHTLNIHINAHSGIKNYVCERCGKALQSNGSLCQHKKFCHVADEDKKKYSCNLCDKFYFRSKSLQMHIEQVHENKYLHHCDYCGELTTSRKSRMLHAGGLCKGAKYKTDIDWDNMPNDGKLRCRQCGKAFTRKDSLLEHVESVHEKTRKHKCEGCDQLFKTRGAKSNHRRFYCKNLPHETRPQEAGEAAEPGAGLVAAEALPTLPEVQPPFLAL